jgi:plasmid stability protein
MTAMQSGRINMGTMTIRNLDDKIKKNLRIQAADHGHSMEEEVRQILTTALGKEKDKDEEPLGSRIHELFQEVGGLEITLPERKDQIPMPNLS